MIERPQRNHHSRIHKVSVLTRYAIRHPKNFLKKSIKEYREAKTNVSEGGMAVSTALLGISLTIPPLIAGSTYITHEILKNIPANIVNSIAIGLVGITSLLNIPLESRALHDKGFSNSIPASILYLLTKKAENFTAFFMHFYHLGLLAGINGLSIQVLNILMGNQGKYFSSGLITTAIILSIWNHFTLRPIIKGTTDPFVNSVNSISSKVKRRVFDNLRLYNEV
ncbi:membrane hypothetical protein [Candidatus Roizmanbacteria bacterium]|nr:membrane hypothetical protein [Candidatus Roizmanbacteria bacterium]